MVWTTTQEPFFSPTLSKDSKEKSDSNITCFICGSCLPTWRLVIPNSSRFTFTSMNGTGPAVEIEVGSFDTNQTLDSIPVMERL